MNNKLVSIESADLATVTGGRSFLDRAKGFVKKHGRDLLTPVFPPLAIKRGAEAIYNHGKKTGSRC